ncbi:MAG: class I SAM-dependent methyltransferase [Deltaproteobacteria bacterium]|nr:class I SAM-dependent methyltransferase [Deltaproteobacteria bacterium]
MRFARYDRIARHYPQMWPLIVPGYLPILNGMLDVLRAGPNRPQEILDLGCGPGSATVAVAPACDPHGSITLVDGSAAMVSAAQDVLGDSVQHAVVGDFAEPAVAAQVYVAQAYDLALSSFALHHLEDPLKRQVIDGLGLSVRKGGLLLLADEIASDRPAGWDLVPTIRARIIQEHLQAGRISHEFWELETSLSADDHLPFMPARVDEITSFMARAGFAVSCPIIILGSALFVGVKTA